MFWSGLWCCLVLACRISKCGVRKQYHSENKVDWKAEIMLQNFKASWINDKACVDNKIS